MKILKSKKMLLSLVCALVLVFGSCMTVCASGSGVLYEKYGADYELAYNFVVNEYGIKFPYQCFITNGDACSLVVSESAFYISGSNFKSDSPMYIAHVNNHVCDKSQIVYGVTYDNTLTLIFNHDLYSKDGLTLYHSVDDTGFFFNTPVLRGVMKTVEMTSPLVQILGLIPLLVPCLVGLVALRKGLATLFKTLHKA